MRDFALALDPDVPLWHLYYGPVVCSLDPESLRGHDAPVNHLIAVEGVHEGYHFPMQLALLVRWRLLAAEENFVGEEEA